MPAARKNAVRVAILFLVNILIFSLYFCYISSEAAVYRQGSTGETVRQIQTNLKKWGYYTGYVDGIYGSKTTAAVKSFQRKNGLSVDGVAGPKTLAALGIASASGSSSSSSKKPISCVSISARTSAAFPVSSG